MDTKNIVQEVKSFGQSKTLKTIIVVVCVLFASLLIFQAGVFVGFHKANFSRGLGDNYNRTFGQPQRGGMMGLTEQNGVAGKIVSINLPTLVVSGQDGVEKVVLIEDDTAIRQLRGEIKSSDLKIDDYIVVFGSSNDQSQIEAKLIRIMPANAPTSMMNINRRIQ